MSINEQLKQQHLYNQQISSKATKQPEPQPKPKPRRAKAEE